ncbi:TonB-dependent receptor [Pelomonas sp. V22]|uniref:TonB-dependent receptor domain-containing protein n=1 Tax=Pelomonas sp. V22 TaxID=2822139 RepID=UPI0024A8572A|nr:TonB-dependent receptor [Pelomonas sp. V22]MDI4634094.1 TonB-dependent receptor [Pelomonas sp. V22]
MHKSRRIHSVPNAVALAVASLAVPASFAQTATNTMERIQITGSSIKQLAGEAALPVSTVKAAELEARGHTELKDLLLELPQSLSLGTNAGAAGPMLNLRGLGPMRTLTLLNGRRMANEPLQDQYVSVNVIPRMALDRAETLRDGASAIYGSDAIGGVQNFITKDSFKGVKVKAEYNMPEHSGGGETKAVGLIAGIGDLAEQGWNAYISLDRQKKSALFKGDRPELFDNAVLNGLGLGLTPDNKNPSPSANFGFATGSNSNYNPAYATGCLAPYSLPTLGAGSVATPATYSAGCYRNPLFFDAVTDGSEITNVYGKASLNLPGGHRLGLELLHSQFLVKKYRGMQTPGSTAPATTYNMPATSKYYPGKGITPAIQVIGSNTGANSPTAFIDATKTPGTVSTLNMNNRTIYFVWGPAELGSAYRNDEQFNDRLVLSAEGTVGKWDYRLGLNYGASERDTRAGGGYILYSKAQEGFTKGILNPFGLQDAEGLAYLKSIEASDYSYRNNKAFNQSIDLNLTRELMNLPGGPLMLALSGELRRDLAKVAAAPLDYVATVNGALAIDSFGNITKHDLVGETPSGVARKLKRDIHSAVAEVDAPITKQLTLNAAVRADHYSDLKTTTVNPKLSARYQPMTELVLRASANTGFRAPSIMDIQNPTPEVRTQLMDDPVLCPSAQPTVTNTGNPVTGYTRDQVCNVLTNYWTKSPDNSHLKPEKSKGWTLGAAIEPIKGLLLTADYWGSSLRDVLGAVTIAEVQQAPAKYSTNIARKSDGTIDYIVASQANRGDISIRGLDLSAAYRFPATDWGTFNVQLDGTYYEKYDFTAEKGGELLHDVGVITNDGRYGGAGVNAGLAGAPQLNFRWKHTASIGWRLGPWSAQLSQRLNSGLTDLTPRAGSTYTRVKGYTQYNISAAYTGFKNTKLSLAVNNIANVDPMLTANTIYTGYITSAADILGRAFKFTAEYSF